jgi:plastocyanin
MDGIHSWEAARNRIGRRGFLGGLTVLSATVLAACSGGTASSSNASAATAVSNVNTALNSEAKAAQSIGNSATVKMTDANVYDPATITIAKGGTVTWQNASQTVHSATFDPSKAAKAGDCSLPQGVQPFDSGLLQPGQTFSHTFDTAGTYKYFCVPHETLGMLGTVIVQ